MLCSHRDLPLLSAALVPFEDLKHICMVSSTDLEGQPLGV